MGFRPTPGRVPNAPFPNAWDTLWSLGPMARSVEDAALLLSAMAGPDPASPPSIAEEGRVFARPLARDFRKVRVAWSRDLGGLPVDPRVTRAVSPPNYYGVPEGLFARAPLAVAQDGSAPSVLAIPAPASVSAGPHP